MTSEIGRSCDSVVVFAGGPDLAATEIPSGALIIGVDGGAEYALACGLSVDIALGDFDSISERGLAELERCGVRLERHRPDKDATDLELGLDFALALSPRRLLVIGSAGGRVDHAFGQLLLLASDAYRDVEVDAQLGRAVVHVIWRERSLQGEPGELVSLFALGGPAVGVVTEGLVYPLRGEVLAPGSSRGIANVFAAARARVTLERGVLLAVRPGEQGLGLFAAGG